MGDKTLKKFDRLIKLLESKNKQNEYTKKIIDVLKRDRDSYCSITGNHYNKNTRG